VQYPWGGVGYLHKDSLRVPEEEGEDREESVVEEELEEEETEEELEERKRKEEESLRALCVEHRLAVGGSSDEMCERLRAALGWNQLDFEQALMDLSQKTATGEEEKAEEEKSEEEKAEEDQTGGEGGEEKGGKEGNRDDDSYQGEEDDDVFVQRKPQFAQRHIRNHTVSAELESPGTALQRHRRSRTTSESALEHDLYGGRLSPPPGIRGFSLSPKTSRKSGGRSRSMSGVQRSQWQRHLDLERDRSSSTHQQRLSGSLNQEDLYELKRQNSVPSATGVELPLSLNVMLTRGSQMSSVAKRRNSESGFNIRQDVLRRRSISETAPSDEALRLENLDLNLDLNVALGSSPREDETTPPPPPPLPFSEAGAASKNKERTEEKDEKDIDLMNLPAKERIQETRRRIKERIARQQEERKSKREGSRMGDGADTGIVPPKTSQTGWEFIRGIVGGTGGEDEEASRKEEASSKEKPLQAAAHSVIQAEVRTKIVKEAVKEKETSGKITAEERAIIMEADQRLKAHLEEERKEAETLSKQSLGSPGEGAGAGTSPSKGKESWYPGKHLRAAVNGLVAPNEEAAASSILGNTFSLKNWTSSPPKAGVAVEATNEQPAILVQPQEAGGDGKAGGGNKPTAETETKSMPACPECQFCCSTKFCGECGARMVEEGSEEKKKEEQTQKEEKKTEAASVGSTTDQYGEEKERAGAAGGQQVAQVGSWGTRLSLSSRFLEKQKGGGSTSSTASTASTAFPKPDLERKTREQQRKTRQHDRKKREQERKAREQERKAREQERAQEPKQEQEALVETPGSGHEDRRWQLSSLDTPDPSSVLLDSIYEAYDGSMQSVHASPQQYDEVENRNRSRSVPLAMLAEQEEHMLVRPRAGSVRQRAEESTPPSRGAGSGLGSVGGSGGGGSGGSSSRRGSRTNTVSLTSVRKLFSKKQRRSSNDGTGSDLVANTSADLSQRGTGQGDEREGTDGGTPSTPTPEKDNATRPPGSAPAATHTRRRSNGFMRRIKAAAGEAAAAPK
jgi:hypothetical protein